MRMLICSTSTFASFLTYFVLFDMKDALFFSEVERHQVVDLFCIKIYFDMKDTLSFTEVERHEVMGYFAHLNTC